MKQKEETKAAKTKKKDNGLVHKVRGLGEETWCGLKIDEVERTTGCAYQVTCPDCEREWKENF